MRILIIAALLGGGLFAQTPSPKPAEPAPQTPEPAQRYTKSIQSLQNLQNWIQSNDGKFRVVLPPTSIVVTPEDSGGIALPDSKHLTFTPGQVTLAPGQPCAIPLLNATPKGGFTGDSKIFIPGSKLDNLDSKFVVRPPAPSCADVKR